MFEEPYVIRMVGSPARFANEQGELTAPEITQEGEEGDVRATGGVRGLFRQEDDSSTLSVGGAKGPVRVESVEATWDRQTPSYKFERNVRLWQGENLLLAEEIETLTDSDMVIARGGIRMRLEPPETEAEDGEDPQQQDPAEITSEWMEYSMDTGLVTFHENVVMVQTGYQMSCARAEAMIEQEGGMKSLFCEGDVEVRDSVAGRTVTGDDALYQVDEGEITFHGNPVVMKGDQGEHVEGATLVYDLETGAARIKRGTGTGVAAPLEEDPESETSPGAAADGPHDPPAEQDDGIDPKSNRGPGI
jgi:lipopolysaccharide transport protein LptA